MMHWSMTPPMPEGQATLVSAADVELTSYILLSKLVSGSSVSGSSDIVNSGLPIVKWLTQQRNGHGGFASTQDTIVALNALSEYAALVYGESIDLEVCASGADISDCFLVNDDNALVQYQVPISVPNSLTVLTTGQGCVFVQSTVRYNIPEVPQPEDAFFLKVRTARTEDSCKQRTISACARYVGSDGVSNMAVMAVKMISGWIPVKESIKSLMLNKALPLKRFEIDMPWVNFYFDELSSQYTCLEFLVEQHMDVGNAKPGLVHVYDYYDKEVFSQMSYSIRPICGTKEELPHLSLEEFIEAEREHPVEQRRVPDELIEVESVAPGPMNAQGLAADNRPFMPETLQGTCPVCISGLPDNFHEMFCNSAHVYKVHMRPGRTYPAKFLADLRPESGKRSIGVMSTYSAPADCMCRAIATYYKGKVVVLSRFSTLLYTEGNRGHIDFNAGHTIITVDEDEIRQINRSNPCQLEV